MKGLALLAIFALAFFLAHLARENELVRQTVENLGYLGVLIVSFISGFNLAVPIPAVAFLPLFLEAGLSFWICALIITFGMTVADSLVYAFASFGRRVLFDVWGRNIRVRLDSLRVKHIFLPLLVLFFFAAFAPLPNEVLLIPMAFFGYKIKNVLPVIFLGNLVFVFLYSAIILGLFSIF